jgi:hypothetical protein
LRQKCCSVTNIIRRHTDNMKLLLRCILILSHPLIFFRFLFCHYMVLFLFNIVISVFLLKESMYSYCCLCTCILIVRPYILNVVYVFVLLSMYSYCCLCILIVRPCILIVVYVFLTLSMYVYSYCRLCTCIFIVVYVRVFLLFVHVFLLLSMYVYSYCSSMYSYCCLCTCIIIVRPCILNVVYMFLLLSMYSYCSSMYSYRCLCILRRGYPD